MIFFFQFLQAGGRWEDFLSRCPLHYTGNRGSGADHIMGTVSEDAVRLGMRRIEEKAGLDWISMQILGGISPVFGVPWILDIDVTVKPLYGRQEDAVVGHPSHVDHSYFVANLRISLGVEVRPGIALDG